MKLSFTFVLLLLTLCSLAQSRQKLKRQRLQEELKASLPYAVSSSFNHENIQDRYFINPNFNPFYLRGDFDNDRSMDYAVAVVEKVSDKSGMIIFHTNSKQYQVVGAGISIHNEKTNDYRMFDSWEVTDFNGPKEAIEKWNGEPIVFKNKGKRIGFVYWSKEGYKWFQTQ